MNACAPQGKTLPLGPLQRGKEGLKELLRVLVVQVARMRTRGTQCGQPQAGHLWRTTWSGGQPISWAALGVS